MFNGDVCEGIAADTFDRTNRLPATTRPALRPYGVLRPLDLMQPYRLEMGAGFANSRGKTSTNFGAIKSPTCSTKH